MEKLRILDNLTNIKEIDNVSLTGQLVCECGCEMFNIYHTGIQTSGLVSTDIVKVKNQIVILGKCSQCFETIKIYDTSIDGIEVTSKVNSNYKQFVKKDVKKFKIYLSYNYFKESFKSNYFLDIFIDVENNKFKKKKRIYE